MNYRIVSVFRIIGVIISSIKTIVGINSIPKSCIIIVISSSIRIEGILSVLILLVLALFVVLVPSI